MPFEKKVGDDGKEYDVVYGEDGSSTEHRMVNAKNGDQNGQDIQHFSKDSDGNVIGRITEHVNSEPHFHGDTSALTPTD